MSNTFEYTDADGTHVRHTITFANQSTYEYTGADGTRVRHTVVYDDESSTATTSNNIGAGRTLGKVIGVAGRKLERMLGGLAQKLGYTPDAILRYVLTASLVRGERGMGRPELYTVPPASRKKISKKLSRLLKHTQYVG